MKLTDRTAYDTYVRGVVALNHADLHEAAEPLRKRMNAAYAALVTLMDAAGGVVARDKVTILINAGDLLTDATITDWWATHCHGGHS